MHCLHDIKTIEGFYHNEGMIRMGYVLTIQIHEMESYTQKSDGSYCH